MHTTLIFLWIYAAMLACAFWESYAEGRNAWNSRKLGWEIRVGGFTLSAYHFYLFWIMFPILLTLPFIIYGWDLILFGIILSAYSSGMIIQDLGWYIVNPAVRFRELFTSFSDYYPWFKIGKRKIIPVGHVLGIIVALLSWYLLWR